MEIKTSKMRELKLNALDLTLKFFKDYCAKADFDKIESFYARVINGMDIDTAYALSVLNFDELNETQKDFFEGVLAVNSALYRILKDGLKMGFDYETVITLMEKSLEMIVNTVLTYVRYERMNKEYGWFKPLDLDSVCTLLLYIMHVLSPAFLS